MDWNDWTIATMADSSGNMDMFLYDKSTGALSLWEDFTVDDSAGTASYTSYELSPDWNPGSLAGLRAADITGTGPALWAITTSGQVTSWTATGLPGTPAITEAASQSLLAPVHAWRLGDGTSGEATTAADTGSGTALPLAGNAGTTWSTADLFNPAVTFNGSNGYMATSGQAVNTTGSYTVSAWVKPAVLDGIVLSQYGSEASCLRISIAGDSWRAGVTSANSASATSTLATAGITYNIRLGVWTHLTVTYNSGTGRLTLYVDGIDAANVLATTWSSGCNTFALGQWNNGGALGGYFNGKIADVQTWGTFLTPTAVATLSGTPGYVLFPNDGHQYQSASSSTAWQWTTDAGEMRFYQGLLTITQTGSGTATTTFGTSGYPDAYLTLQSDGNLVIYSGGTSSKAIWASNTATDPGDSMFFQPDGNLVIYTQDGAVLWASNTSN